MSAADIARVIRDRDSVALADFPTGDVAEHLVALAAAEASRWPSSDLDGLMSVGAMSVAAGHRDADTALLAWLVAAPSPARLRIVATLLGTMWSPATRRPLPPVESDKIRSLLAVGRQLAWDPLVHPPYLAAVAGAALASRDPEIRRAALVELQAASRRDPALGAAFRTHVRRLVTPVTWNEHRA